MFLKPEMKCNVRVVPKTGQCGFIRDLCDVADTYCDGH